MKFIQRGNKVFQYFIFDDVKSSKLLRDSRYSIYDKLEKKIKELSISTLEPESFSFLERVDGDDKITIVVSELPREDSYQFKNYYFTISSFVSRSPGCITCSNNKNGATVFVECAKKNKIIPKAMKSCSLFKEEEKLFKT